MRTISSISPNGENQALFETSPDLELRKARNKGDGVLRLAPSDPSSPIEDATINRCLDALDNGEFTVVEPENLHRYGIDPAMVNMAEHNTKKFILEESSEHYVYTGHQLLSHELAPCLSYAFGLKNPPNVYIGNKPKELYISPSASVAKENSSTSKKPKKIIESKPLPTSETSQRLPATKTSSPLDIFLGISIGYHGMAEGARWVHVSKIEFTPGITYDGKYIGLEASLLIAGGTGLNQIYERNPHRIGLTKSKPTDAFQPSADIKTGLRLGMRILNLGRSHAHHLIFATQGGVGHEFNSLQFKSHIAAQVNSYGEGGVALTADFALPQSQGVRLFITGQFNLRKGFFAEDPVGPSTGFAFGFKI